MGGNVDFDKLYYVEDLLFGDVVRCRTGRAWMLNPSRKRYGSTDFTEMRGVVGVNLGTHGEDAFFLIEGQIRQFVDSHSESTRWEILGEDFER